MNTLEMSEARNARGNQIAASEQMISVHKVIGGRIFNHLIAA